MQKLKELYDIKKQLVANDINELGNILKENTNIETINVNPDNTIYLESNCGVDSIRNDLNVSVKKLLCVDDHSVIHNFIFNALPLTNNSCIIRI